MLCAELTAANVMNRMFVSFRNSYVETLIPNTMVLIGEAFRTIRS